MADLIEICKNGLHGGQLSGESLKTMPDNTSVGVFMAREFLARPG
jgi:hypothetical protein